MRYSLLSRFRGCLLGAIVGQTFGSNIDKQPQQLEGWGQLAVLGVESLTQIGKFDSDDWRSRFYFKFPSLELGNRVLPGAITSIPIAIFYHENEIKLRNNLLSLVDLWQYDTVNRDSVLALGYAIAQCLKEKLQPTTLIEQTIAFLGAPNLVAQELAQVQALLEQGAGLEKAITQLNKRDAQLDTSIALAFYCFLSTPEELRLSILRAARTGYQPQITTALTGALSGAYNSTSGIPTTLQMVLSRSATTPLTAWGMTTTAEMLKLIDHMFAVWSGIYDQTRDSNQLLSVAAIASPRVIRLR